VPTSRMGQVSQRSDIGYQNSAQVEKKDVNRLSISFDALGGIYEMSFAAMRSGGGAGGLVTDG